MREWHSCLPVNLMAGGSSVRSGSSNLKLYSLGWNMNTERNVVLNLYKCIKLVGLNQIIKKCWKSLKNVNIKKWLKINLEEMFLWPILLFCYRWHKMNLKIYIFISHLNFNPNRVFVFFT